MAHGIIKRLIHRVGMIFMHKKFTLSRINEYTTTMIMMVTSIITCGFRKLFSMSNYLEHIDPASQRCHYWMLMITRAQHIHIYICLHIYINGYTYTHIYIQVYIYHLEDELDREMALLDVDDNKGTTCTFEYFPCTHSRPLMIESAVFVTGGTPINNLPNATDTMPFIGVVMKVSI
jgi:hypothetical protein